MITNFTNLAFFFSSLFYLFVRWTFIFKTSKKKKRFIHVRKMKILKCWKFSRSVFSYKSLSQKKKDDIIFPKTKAKLTETAFFFCNSDEFFFLINEQMLDVFFTSYSKNGSFFHFIIFFKCKKKKKKKQQEKNNFFFWNTHRFFF